MSLGGAVKRLKLKAISYGFRRPRDPRTECCRIPRGDMGWYIMDFHDFVELFVLWNSGAIQMVRSTRDAL